MLETIIKQLIKSKPRSEKELMKTVRQQSNRLKIQPVRKSDLIAVYHKLVRRGKIKTNLILEKFLTKRAVRTMSGVAVISVLTKPHLCTGQCLFCPTEVDMPKSYLSNEPAVMRAILNKFDPYRQITMRLKALQANGHETDKIELIIMGGTWSCHDLKYQNWYIKRCFEALNGKKAKGLAPAQKQNETAKHRCIGLTLETRPDYINEAEIIRLRNFGCTRVELGIQHIDDQVLKLNQRGHTVRQSVEAIKMLKQAGFKINFHLMVNLPGSTVKKDYEMFKRIYTNPDFMPDMIKIYPCVVNKNAKLYKLYKQGKYKPYTDEQLLELIKKIKKITPEYVRITRLIRDIPKESIVAGNKITNLRQLIGDQSVKEGWSCRCIRCREIGHSTKSPACAGRQNHKIKKSKLVVRNYQASDGQEYFISYELSDEKVLYAFARLRVNHFPPFQGGIKGGVPNFIPALKNAALIRELHTYGQMITVGEKGEVQHSGLGKKLMAEAEKICRKNKIRKLAVISGIGVRQYYQKLGYRQEGTYMVKEITENTKTRKTQKH